MEHYYHRKAAPYSPIAHDAISPHQHCPFLHTTTDTTQKNEILKSLIEKTGTGESKTPAFKYIANSTIIQHLGSPSDTANVGRRGMHSAVGAYWNNEKDGTYSYKWEGAEKKGMDIVISITWIGL